MRVRHVKSAIVGSILSLLFPASASALPAEQSVGFQFTFNPSLAITLSSDELVVSNLLPGNYASSNTITIDVQTNNHSGYTLTAAVGDSEVPTLANSSLVNTAVNGATFTSLASNANLTLANFGSNYWGYTTTQSLSDSSLYSGLTYGTATTLNQTVDPSGKSVNGYYGGNTTDFTIGVNAGADQVSGEYTNVISFAIVPNISTDFIIESLKYLQDFTELADDEMTSVINSMAAGQSYQLIDARDGEIYNIAKLADGKVWLQDNLALDLSTANSLTAADTNIRTGWNVPAEVTTWANSYTDPKINTASKNTNVALGMEQSGTGKVGVYYNYCAASAGTYCMDSGSGSGDAIYDICPAGWRMPTGGASGEYQALYTAYSSNNATFVNALRTPLSGLFVNGSASNLGAYGFFWSSTRYVSSDIYDLRVGLSSVDLQNYNGRSNGISIRCLLDPATPYTVYYDKNTTDTVSDLPSTWNGTINTVRRPTLSTATPTRSNYNFIGWCDTLPTTSGDTDTCSGTTYTPGSELPASGNSSTVYAMWKAKYTITLALAGNATGITIDGTNYTTSATLTAGTYTISGSYVSGYEFDSWSTSGSISVASTSSASTTLTVTGAGTLTLNGKSSKLFFQNATSAQCGQTMYDNRGTDAYKDIAYSTASINGLCWMTRNLDLPGGTTLTSADSNVTSDYTLPASSTDGFSSANTAYVYNSGSTTCGDGSPCYSYYDYAAATAGTNPSSGEATSDICPKGWRLPTNAEYTALINTYTTGATLTAIPWNGAYAGIYVFSSFSNGGSWGYYWSSTASDSSYAYFMGFDSSSAATSAYGAKGFYGSSIRCVFEATNISEISTMQDFATNNATAIKDSMTAGQQYTLTDSRNGNKNYTVAKIGDLVWMTTNLDLPGGTTLTPADSNVTITHTISSSSTDGFSDTSIYYVYNSGSTTCGDGSPCYSYYSYPRWSYGDVCPKGWRLPTNAEYTALINTYTTGAALTASPFYGVYAGYYYNSSFYDGGSSGHYWTSTAYDNLAVNAYHLNFNSSSVNMHGSSVAYGFSVRCVAK